MVPLQTSPTEYEVCRCILFLPDVVQGWSGDEPGRREAEVRDRFGLPPGKPSQKEPLPLAGSFEAQSFSTDGVREVGAIEKCDLNKLRLLVLCSSAREAQSRNKILLAGGAHSIWILQRVLSTIFRKYLQTWTYIVQQLDKMAGATVVGDAKNPAYILLSMS